MKINDETVEQMEEFTADVIGITSFDGHPESVIVYNEGKLIVASLTEETSSGIPKEVNRKIGNPPSGSTIRAPDGMKVTVSHINRKIARVRNLVQEDLEDDIYTVKSLFF